MATFIQSGDPGREETPPRLREDLKQRHQRATAADEFRAMLNALGLTPRHAARLFATSSRNLRRWRDGTRRIPRAVTLVCRLMAVGAVTIEQVEAAAVPSPIRTNGGMPPAPLRAAPALEERSASAPRRAKTATLVGPSSTTIVVEQVVALAAGCRWPCGDLGHPDFHFCGGMVTRGPYCEHHRAMAYLAPRSGRGQGVRIGFVAHRRQLRLQLAPALGSPPTPGALPATSVSPLPNSQATLPGHAPPPV